MMGRILKNRMLPLFLCPFKHYLSDLISGVLTGNQKFSSGPAEDYPCEMTIERWRCWAGENFCNLADNPLYRCFDRVRGCYTRERM